MKRTVHFGNKTLHIDIGFILILLILCFTSCFALYNSFNLVKRGLGSNYLMKQILWYVVGFSSMALIGAFPNKKLFEFIEDAYKFLMLCLLYLFFSMILFRFTGYTLPLTTEINGAISWFQIPALGSFQPSEFIKIILIIQVAQIITDYQKKHKDPTVHEDFMLLVQIAKVTLPPLILIFLQPDTGLCIIIAFTILVLLMCSGIKKEYIFILFGCILLVFGIFFYLYFFHVDSMRSLLGYRFERIEAWLDPESHIRGSSNQLYTALLSLGSAGVSGYGMQANIIAIPEAHTDFIFAAFGQCFGLLGTSFILIVCILLDLYLCKVAYNIKNRKNRLIVIGVIAMLFYQQFQNLGMIVGLLPITGITLPLISYGGSSILSYFIAFGFVQNMVPSVRRKKRSFKRRKKEPISV